MRSQFIVQLFAADQPVRWIRVGDNAHLAVHSGRLEEAARQSLGAQVVVLVPSEDILLTQVNLPTTNRQKMIKALPYALEDQVVGEVEEMHFAAGERNADGLMSVAVCSRNCMDSWLARLKEVGLMADIIMPDCLALPLNEGHWSLLREGSRFLLRNGAQQGYIFESDSRDLHLGFIAQDAAKAEIAALDYWSDEPLQWEGLNLVHQVTENGLLTLILQHGLPAKLMNLLQGDYSRREQLGKLWRPWRFAASVAAVWFVLSLSIAMVENAQLRSQQQALQDQAVAIYKELFPDARNVPNPRAQMEQKLKELRGNGQSGDQAFLAILAGSGPSFRDTTGVKLRSLRYKNGVLDVELEVPSLQTLDKLKQTLVANAKMEVEIQSAAAKDSVVQGRLQIKRGAS